jgi:hypothetical protein
MVAAFGVIILLSSPANAIATFSASSSATVTITGFSTTSGPVSKPPTLVVEGTSDPSVSESGTSISGTGTAAITETTLVISGTPLAMVAGDSVSHMATASGGATVPGGQSAADQVTNGEIFFGNAGTEDITVTLGIDWVYSLMASRSGINQKAFAFASIIVDTLIFDSIGDQVGEDIFHVDELAIANGINGAFETLTDSATLSVDVVVLAGSVTSVGLFVDARGAAEVPAPSSLILFCLAILGVGFSRKRLTRQLSA